MDIFWVRFSDPKLSFSPTIIGCGRLWIFFESDFRTQNFSFNPPATYGLLPTMDIFWVRFSGPKVFFSVHHLWVRRWMSFYSDIRTPIPFFSQPFKTHSVWTHSITWCSLHNTLTKCILEKNIKPLCCSSLKNKSFVLIYEDSTNKRMSKAGQKSRFIFRNVNRSIALQSPYMQIRVKLSVLNGNTAKHLFLRLDPRQSTQPSHGLYAT